MIGPLNNLNDLLFLRAAQQNRLAMNQAMQRLATGTRINSGADDPAGLIASTNMDATLAELDAQTSANERAMQAADTADAALGQVSDLLTQAKTLAMANSDSTLSAEETQANQLEINAILYSVDRIASSTEFNGQKLLDGTGEISASGAKLKIDSTATADIGQVEVDGTDYTLSDLRSGKGLDTTGDHFRDSSRSVDAAIRQVATERATIGAFSSNTLQSHLNILTNQKEQLIATVAMIRDTDYAAEGSAKIRAELLDQATKLLMKRVHPSLGAIVDVKA